MKKKITIGLAVVLTLAFAISVLTACSLGGGNKGNDNKTNENETTQLDASECSSELNEAIAASIAKNNYSIKVIDATDSPVLNIEYDGDTQHVISIQTHSPSDGTTGLYTETYLFVQDGKYYSSSRTAENASFPDPAELDSKAEFDKRTASWLLNSIIGKFTLNDSAEVTYSGEKIGTTLTVYTTTVAEISGVKTELFTSYKIKNGLVDSMLQRVSEYDEHDVGTITTENTITVRYDIGTVELPQTFISNNA